MTDPNTVYKLAFADLTRKLGRVPNANECLGIHEEYKRAWAPAEETVLAPSTQVRAREALEPLSGPTINAEPPERRSAPELPSAPPRNYQGLIEGDRGPGGGLICKCQACGQLWERPRSKGRPAYRCETCRN